MDGICTLANDAVYDQLIALLNSIEVIQGQNMPVCVYPYDDNIEKIAAEIAKRPNVQLYADKESIQRWDDFVRSAWDAHPTALQEWRKIGKETYYRLGCHRRFCAFDAPFERFIYMDADTLLMKPVDNIFSFLDSNDWVVYDFQHKEPMYVYNIASPKLLEIFPLEKIQTQIFCSGLYASKKNIFSQETKEWLLARLRAGEAEILYPMAPDQSLLNYMMMRAGILCYNLALKLPPDEITGCCVTSPHFEERENILYDKNQRLTYIHYIGIPAKVFTRLCAGENLDFRYRDVFLYYRYLHEPEKKPKFKNKPKPYDAPPSFIERVLRKLGFFHG